MAEYKNPPITESIIEIQPKANISLKTIDKFQHKLAKRYPVQQQLMSTTINIKAHDAVDAQARKEGIRLASSDGADIVVIKNNSFAVSRLAPYVGWDLLLETFKSAYDVLLKVSDARGAGRLGIRYINRIDVPNPSGTLRIEDYMNLSINTPDDEDLISRYSLQAVFPHAESGAQIIVNSALVPPVLIQTTSFILDIDVGMETSRIEAPEIFEKFASMRELKNKSFERFLTSKAKELFN